MKYVNTHHRVGHISHSAGVSVTPHKLSLKQQVYWWTGTLGGGF